MKLRFLETLPSSNPDYPFQAGQIIVVGRLTPEQQRWVREGRVAVVHEAQPETAVPPTPERAVLPRKKR